MATPTPYTPAKNTFERNQLADIFRYLRANHPAKARLFYKRYKEIEKSLSNDIADSIFGPMATDPPPSPSGPIDPQRARALK